MRVRVGTTVYKQANAPKLYIMRGVSGSGKSTKAKQLAPGPEHIFSTDDFFTSPSGKYSFDINFINDAHGWNKDRVQRAISEGVDPIVVDNTTVRGWEAKPYVEMALDAGYEVEVVEPDSPWWQKFRPELSDAALKELTETMAAKNSHGVPEDVIMKMLINWEWDLTVDDILSSEKPES